MTAKPRPVASVVDSTATFEGGGFMVQRPFPTSELSQFDPFLLLDEMGPMDVGPGGAKGAPDHPHRGFETVTYLLSGEMEHRDSAGHAGTLRPGDVQWMTAGDGIVHSELPSEAFQRQGGRMHGFQLWVNLPRRDKRMKPRYQEIPAARIPKVRSADGLVTARVIAGTVLGATAVIETQTPILYVHLTIAPGGKLVQPVPASWNVLSYVIDGEGAFGRDEVRARDAQAVLFGASGDVAVVTNPGPAPLEALLLGGEPLRETVARYGPFVMNTDAEIEQAIADYRSGRLGRKQVG
jgi:redox-sensitive bicupin YhaK (pirin superfamily)